MRFTQTITLIGIMAVAVCRPAFASSTPAMSIGPLFAAADCEAIPELGGEWASEGDMDGIWRIERLKNGSYRLFESRAHSDNSIPLAFNICVAHVGGHLFFDATSQLLAPDGSNALLADEITPFWVPLHFVGRLEVSDASLQFQLLDQDWLTDALGSGRVQLSYLHDEDGTLLVTAPSKELRQFAALFATEIDAFSDVVEFDRVLSSEANVTYKLPRRPLRKSRTVLALVSIVDSITSLPEKSRAATEIASLCTSVPI